MHMQMLRVVICDNSSSSRSCSCSSSDRWESPQAVLSPSALFGAFKCFVSFTLFTNVCFHDDLSLSSNVFLFVVVVVPVAVV